MLLFISLVFGWTSWLCACELLFYLFAHVFDHMLPLMLVGWYYLLYPYMIIHLLGDECMLWVSIILSARPRCMWHGRHYKKNTLLWWYMFVTVGHVFCHPCTSMKILWQNQDSHTCAVVEVLHDITKIIITEVSTPMTKNRASQKCFRQGWPTCGIHRNGTTLSYRVRYWIW